MLYSDFNTLSKDQEQLISSENTFDYIEGFVMTGPVNNWRFTFNTKELLQASKLSSKGKTLYGLELAMYFNPEDVNVTNQVRISHALPPLPLLWLKLFFHGVQCIVLAVYFISNYTLV